MWKDRRVETNRFFGPSRLLLDEQQVWSEARLRVRHRIRQAREVNKGFRDGRSSIPDALRHLANGRAARAGEDAWERPRFNYKYHDNHYTDVSANPMTSIPIHADVLRRLQARKTGGKTWDDFLLDLVEDFDPPEWTVEMERRKRRGRDVSGTLIERLHAELKRQGR